MNHVKVDICLHINIHNTDDEEFIISTCDVYKIESTGECVEECPTLSPYYNFDYNSEEINYIKSTAFIPPKYLFSKICYESCPSNTIPDDINNKCKCQFAFTSL